MFRFTIRDVLWLTVVVALAVGWWLDRARLARMEQRNQVLQQHHAEIQMELLRAKELRGEVILSPAPRGGVR